jgi:chaperonin cofactor prefoldin
MSDDIDDHTLSLEERLNARIDRLRKEQERLQVEIKVIDKQIEVLLEVVEPKPAPQQGKDNG